MDSIQAEFDRLANTENLSKVLGDIDKVLALAQNARDQIAANPSSHALTMAKLHQSMSAAMNKIGQDHKDIYKALNGYGKAVDKKFKAASQYNSTDYDALSDDKNLINRAVAMHLIREGNFSVANEFLEEAGPSVDIPSHLQQEFHEMYTIISAMRKERDLGPAIAWAASKAPLLEARGSNLEFDLVRLQFVHLFLSPEDEDTEMQEDGKRPRKAEALAYSQKEFQRFYKKHSKDIERLMCAFIYPDLEKSPYSRPFQAPEKTWEEVACAFTKEFCSLLGLSAESPLYIAATAGAIALPTLLKMTSIMKEKRTEWTTQNELPVEIPLPPDYHFHPIFVCPVSKDQTTEDNPPMILPCGHVIARESLQRLAKGGSSVSLKCPYCPKECTMHQAKQVII